MGIVNVGVDNGYGNTKGTSFVIPSSVKKLAVKPPIESRTVEWNGSYYALGTRRMEIQRSKVENEDTLVLTMAVIAEKFKSMGKTSGDIRLGVGLPLTRMGAEKTDFNNYFLNHKKLNFKYEGKSYFTYIVSVDVFPQGYAAVVNRLNTFGMSTVVVDIGSWTVDVLPIIEGEPDVSRCKSLALGTFTAMSEINENLRQKFGEEAEEAIIKDIMIHRTSNIDRDYLDMIQAGLYNYVEEIMNNLRSLKFNSTLTEFVFIGGGATVVKNFGGDLGGNISVIEDVCINAKGYEDILSHKYRMVNK